MAQPAPAVQWEYCEIFWYVKYVGWFGFVGESYFYARAIGPNGVYMVQGSKRPCASRQNMQHTAHIPDENCGAVVNELIRFLVANGWEPTGETGSEWYSYKFRRQVRRENAA